MNKLTLLASRNLIPEFAARKVEVVSRVLATNPRYRLNIKHAFYVPRMDFQEINKT